MKLTIVADKSQFLASTKLLDKIAGSNDNSNQIVITPENATLWAESYLAQKNAEKNASSSEFGGAIGGLLITNFTRLFSKLYPNIKLASTEMNCMLVKNATLSKQMQAFVKSSKKYGFSKEANKMLALAKESGVDISKFSIEGSDALSQKLLDLQTIAMSVDESFPEQTIDRSKKIAYLAKSVDDGFFDGKVVNFVGFDDLSRGSLFLVENIAKHAKEICVSCKEFDNTQTFNYTICDEILDVAKKLNASIEFVRGNGKELNPRQMQIANNLYAKTKVSQNVDGVRVLRAKNRRDEIRLATILIEQKVREGARYRDFEIVVPDFSTYNQLEEHLKKHQIPVFVDTGKNVSGHALFVLVEKFLNLAKKQNDAKMAISLARNVLLGLDFDKVSQYQNFCDKYGLEFEDFSKKLAVGEDDSNFGVANEIHKLIGEIVAMLPQSKASAQDFVNSIQNFFTRFAVECNLKLLEEKQSSNQDKEITEHVYQKFVELCEEISMLLKNKTISIEEFYEIWQSGVLEASVRIVPQGLDCVLVTNVSTSKHKDVPYLIVLGACEGDFPSILSDNGLLTDEELDEINKRFGVSIGPSTKHVNEIEMCKVQELFMLAQKELYVLYPAEVGEEKKFMSLVVQNLCDICAQAGQPLKVEAYDNLKPIQNLMLMKKQACSISGAKEVAYNLLSRSKTLMSFASFGELYGSLKEALEHKNAYESFIQKQEQNSISVGSELFFPASKTSISQLESYFACPYAHFAKYGLRIKEKEEALIKALDIGNFLHKCLEKVTLKFMEKQCEIADPEFAKIMKSVLSQVVKEEKYQAKVNSLQLEALKSEACRLCYAVLKGIERSGFKPVAAEIRFGKEGELSGIKLGDTNVVLEGKIDRMDKCGSMVRLVDYKTGEVDLGIDNLYYGKKLQLFAYLLSVVEDGSLKPAGVFYLPIKSIFQKDSGILDAYKMQGYFSSNLSVVLEFDHDMSLENPKSNLVDMQLSVKKEYLQNGTKVLKPQNHILQETDLLKLAEYAKLIMTKAVEDIKSGNIQAKPLEKDGKCPCEYCQFRCVCKIDEHPEWIRTQKEKITAQEVVGAVTNGIHD